jgi:hypothetical protein
MRSSIHFITGALLEKMPTLPQHVLFSACIRHTRPCRRISLPKASRAGIPLFPWEMRPHHGVF